MQTKAMLVGVRIKNIRQENGMNMTELADYINSKKRSEKTKKGTVNNWEKGVNLPNEKNLKIIASLGNMTVEELLYDPRQDEIARKIKSLRAAKGLSQEEFGKLADNAHKTLVSKWERGLNLPNNKRLKLIAELGGITTDELLQVSDLSQEGCKFCTADLERDEFERYPAGKISITSSEGFFHVQDVFVAGRELVFDAMSEFSDEEITVYVPISYCPACGCSLGKH